ncbi:MAG: MEDS domain-containing protein [Syntrophomonadaceae bacterium]|nr:MEDS domain-containing protein [Syntrophomonadaceae bacterium]
MILQSVSNLEQVFRKLPNSSHLGLLYEKQQQWQAVLASYLQAGLRQGKKCIYIAESDDVQHIRSCLAESGTDPEAAEATGQLVVRIYSEVFARDGFFDPGRTISILVGEARKAAEEGYPALCLTGEMSWALRGYRGVERLMEFEARLNRELLPRYPVSLLCQYDRSRFHPEIIKGVILNHPLVVKEGVVLQNFFYLPPEDFLSPQRGEREVEKWLSCLESAGEGSSGHLLPGRLTQAGRGGPSGSAETVSLNQTPAIYDQQTGLFNLKYFEQQLKRLDEGRFAPLGIIVCELENLKGVPDPATRDQLLLEAAQVIKKCFRDNDIVARVGSEQIGILLANCSRPLVEKTCFRVRDAISRYNQSNPYFDLSIAFRFALKNERI